MCFQVHNVRPKMVAVLREKFAHLNLTFSIGGQISFDVSDIMCLYIWDLYVLGPFKYKAIYCFRMYTSLWERVIPSGSIIIEFSCWMISVTGFPTRLGQDILLEIPWWFFWNPLFWWQNLQGQLSHHLLVLTNFAFYTGIDWKNGHFAWAGREWSWNLRIRKNCRPHRSVLLLN